MKSKELSKVLNHRESRKLIAIPAENIETDGRSKDFDEVQLAKDL